MSSPTLANLEQRLRAAEARAQQLMLATWVMPKSAKHYRTPHLTPEYNAHTILVTQTIPNLRRQIASRRAKNAARRRWNAIRKHVAATGIAKYLHATTYRPPNRSRHNLGGAGYRRTAGTTNVGSPTLARLMRNLEELKAANRGNKVNIYNRMSSTWGRASNSRAAANIMNNAQRVMNRAGLLLRHK